MSEARFQARLTPGAPEPIEVGAGTALLLEGTLDAWQGASEGLRLRLGAIEADVDAVDGRWWSLVRIPAVAPSGPAPIALLTRRADGAEQEVRLGTIDLAASGAEASPGEAQNPSTGGAGSEQPLIAICMATHAPPADRLRLQLDSIREQTWRRWVCVISDDASSPGAFAELERLVAGDERFVLSRSDQRLGFLRNFERAIRMAPGEADMIALADQDDRWYPDKLEAMAGTLARNPEASLAYSDMRITDGEGRVLSDTYWYLRRNRWDDLASLLVANVVTGAASLFHRDLLDDALPFPPAHPSHALYHDHWLALCALAGGGSGGIAYLDRPTYDYFRHDDSITVREAPAWLRPESGFAGRARLHWGRLTRRVRMGSAAPSWERVYRERWLLIRQLVAVLELRLGERIAPRERRAMELLVAAERSPRAAAWMLGRCLRPLIGRNETLARERVLLGGLLWRWRSGGGGRSS